MYPKDSSADATDFKNLLSQYNKSRVPIIFISFKKNEIRLWCMLIVLFIQTEWLKESVDIIFSPSVSNEDIFEISSWLWEHGLRNSDLIQVRDCIYCTGRSSARYRMVHGMNETSFFEQYVTGYVSSEEELIGTVFGQ